LTLGIRGNLPAINCNVLVSQDEQMTIAEALVHLSRNASKQHCNEFVQLLRQLQPVDFKLNGKANWDATLTKTNGRDAQQDQGMRVWRKVDCHTVDRTSTYFQCPRCQHVEHNSCKSFQLNDIDKKQKCNGCKNLSIVARWKCTCMVHWHNCTIHRQDGWPKTKVSMSANTNEQNSENTKHQTMSKKPRLDHTITFEEMLLLEQNRAKRARVMKSGVKTLPSTLVNQG